MWALQPLCCRADSRHLCEEVLEVMECFCLVAFIAFKRRHQRQCLCHMYSWNVSEMFISECNRETGNICLENIWVANFLPAANELFTSHLEVTLV